MNYYCILENFTNNHQTILYKTALLSDAREYIFNFSLDFVLSQQGNLYENKYLDTKKKYLPEGFSVTKSKRNLLGKYTVFEKKSFWMSTELKKVFNVFIVKIPLPSNKKIRKSLMHVSWKDIFEEVLQEIKTVEN